MSDKQKKPPATGEIQNIEMLDETDLDNVTGGIGENNRMLFCKKCNKNTLHIPTTVLGIGECKECNTTRNMKGGTVIKKT